MDPGTAANRLRKSILFSFAKRLDLNWCYQCGCEIKDINKARETADKMLEVKPYFDRYRSRSFFLAMSQLFHNKNYNHKKFIQKLSVYPTKLKFCSNKYDYLKNIEDIFNFNQKK